MSLPIEKITEEALALPSDARALLADRLAESLYPAIDNEVQDAWAKEALHRLAEIESGKVQAIDGDVVIARIHQLLSQPPRNK